MERYIGRIIRSAEKRAADFMQNQIMDTGRRDYGSLRNPIVDVKPTVYVLTTSVAVYLNQESRYCHDPKLYAAINRGLDFIALNQREDGSFDYPTCNFKSAPDTSFCFKRLIAAYRLLQKFDTEDQTKVLKEKYFKILTNALQGIKNGGFHTPNHRWAICAALMQGANLLTGQPAAEIYLDKVKEYLAEGIDGDKDGQYAERSTGGYNAVVNNAMLAMYEESKDETYLGYVERNLHMMLTYIDPDDTIFTQNSTRQDQGRKAYMDLYFYQYLYLTSLHFNPEFDAAAHKIIMDNAERGDPAPDCLHNLMLKDAMYHYKFVGCGFLESYHSYYEKPGIVRVKTPGFGYTVLKGSSAFLFLQVKETPIFLRIGESYCAVRNFIPQTLEAMGKEYTLTSTVQSWYYKPFRDYSGTSDWWEMDHSKRELLHNSEVCLTVHVKELADGLQLTMKAEGLDGLPLRLQICVPSGSILENEHFYLQAEKGSGMILRDGYVNLIHHQNRIQIGPGFGTHEFPGHYSGEEKNDMGYTIYLNEYTPCEKTITLTVAG